MQLQEFEVESVEEIQRNNPELYDVVQAMKQGSKQYRPEDGIVVSERR